MGMSVDLGCEKGLQGIENVLYVSVWCRYERKRRKQLDMLFKRSRVRRCKTLHAHPSESSI